MSNYIPFGFQYPTGFSPNPVINAIKERVDYLNQIHDLTGLPGHIYTAALHLFQCEGKDEPMVFWNKIRNTLSDSELATVIKSLAVKVADEPERLEFPNATALFDCRFISTKEWELIRQYSIGGSEVASILEISPFQNSKILFYQKRHPIPNACDTGLRHILDYGHAVEPYVIDEIAFRLGAKRYPEYRMFAHKKYPFITANPDGILQFPNGNLSLFEAKTAIWLKKADWLKGIPDYYVPQTRQYLEVLDDPRLSDGYIGVCTGALPMDMVCHAYTRDKKLGKLQNEAIVNFWNSYIVPDIEPPSSGNAKLELTTAYHSSVRKDGTLCTLPQSTIHLFESYTKAKNARLSLSKELREKKASENELKKKIKDISLDGPTISTSKDVSYLIEIEDICRRTVSEGLLMRKYPDKWNELVEIASNLAPKSKEWDIPVIRIKNMR